ncbi:MAG: hypothetical protein WA913_05185 [Pricia sp.]
MKNDNLENLFDRLRGSFDIEEPEVGHKERFLEKLDALRSDASREVLADAPIDSVTASTKESKEANSEKKAWWKLLAIAASIALLCALAVGLYESQLTMEEQVAEISPEVSRTQYYFAGLIEQQVSELESKNNPQTRQVIDDAMVQLKKLESDYTRLEKDLVYGGNSKLILSAMITNFQTRIDLLEDVAHEIKTIQKLNTTNDTETTI